MKDHFLLMTLYGLLVSAFFSLLWRDGRDARLRMFLLLFTALEASAIAVGWLMYPFPAHP